MIAINPRTQCCGLPKGSSLLLRKPDRQGGADDDGQRFSPQIVCFRKACARLHLKHVRIKPYMLKMRNWSSIDASR
jgi:hypothetical protein